MTTSEGASSGEDVRPPYRFHQPVPAFDGRRLLPDLDSYFARLANSMTPTFAMFREVQDQLARQLGPMLEALNRVNLGSARGKVATFAQEQTAYSDEMRGPEEYFAPNEVEIDSFDDFHEAIQRLITKNPELQLLWRGQRNSTWGLHSSLFRALMVRNGVRHPSKAHRRSEPYPTEDEMVEAEKAMLWVAADVWRLDGMNALEVFARLQHFGAPTRLLDVSRNPYIAAWFAVERSASDDDKAGRLFALATHPVLPPNQIEVATATLTQIRGLAASGPQPFWHSLETSEARQDFQWGTGAIRRFWIPPIYEQRILAQNGAFVVDGVPLSLTGMAAYFKKPGEGSRYWRRADLLAASSIYTKVYSPARRVAPNTRRPFPPTFTFRISPQGKREIRSVLEERFSYTASTLYPDTEGLAQYVRAGLSEIISRHSHHTDVSH